MKKLFLTVALCCSFSVYGIAVDTNDDNDTYFENYVLRRLIQNDEKDIDKIVLNSRYEVYKSILKAKEAYSKAKIKDVQSDKVFVTKANVLKKCYIEAYKACDKAHTFSRNRVESTSLQLSKLNTVISKAAKMRAILYETETIKSNSNKALKLYNKAAKFYDKAIRVCEDTAIDCSSVNPDIVRKAEKIKGTKEYAGYEAYVAKKRKAADFWAKWQAYVKKLKEVCAAYAKVAAVRIELYEAAKTYAKAAGNYVKAAKVAKSSIEIPEADRLSCFEFEDAVELHKSHKISDAQLASVPASKASGKTIEAYATYCRTKLKLSEAIVAACRKNGEAVKLQTELNNSSVEQDRANVLWQAECISCY